MKTEQRNRKELVLILSKLQKP